MIGSCGIGANKDTSAVATAASIAEKVSRDAAEARGYCGVPVGKVSNKLGQPSPRRTGYLSFLPNKNATRSWISSLDKRFSKPAGIGDCGDGATEATCSIGMRTATASTTAGITS